MRASHLKAHVCVVQHQHRRLVRDTAKSIKHGHYWWWTWKEVQIDYVEAYYLFYWCVWFSSEGDDRPSTAERNRKKFQTIYCAICQQLKIIPVTFFRDNVIASEIKLASRGLGPKGVRAMTVALVVRLAAFSLEFGVRIDMLELSIQMFSALCSYWHRAWSFKLLAKFFLLQNNAYVTHLDVSDNDIQTEGVTCISQMLAENSAITHLVRDVIVQRIIWCWRT